ncbi:hypothetical protein SAMD00019534_044380 [Acytostelium subglobosum LB1]|uniref:hypothetical protein n=1 Tax=Acytostelium subglobosum LB1 TaxID=1410327 RepID=UPI0006449AD9|nr:hypothetical protein SAMD00019534_044380 [Acytostelium subglobosum LB1]GAM21263.1 hypothetical protein SAMD00019534_044380 [Acytostelium subglobosum LB1]|eukprot:XP_012755382.1 hypothetical protein SAMD00019534_044380 [Acytostelium subglobosum LB1]
MLYSCRRCHTRVEDESIYAFGSHYHPHCFVCFDCHEPLSDKYYEIDNLPYCELDFKRPRGPSPGRNSKSPRSSVFKGLGNGHGHGSSARSPPLIQESGAGGSYTSPTSLVATKCDGDQRVHTVCSPSSMCHNDEVGQPSSPVNSSSNTSTPSGDFTMGTVDGQYQRNSVSYSDRSINKTQGASTTTNSLFDCHKCTKEIWGATVVNANGNKFHPQCFQCHECHGSLLKGYVQDAKGYLCAACQVMVNDRNKPLRQQCGHCSACYKRFNVEEHVISIDQERYHPQCFKCCSCRMPIEGLSFSRDRVTSTLSSYCCYSCLSSGRVDRCPECSEAVIGGSSIFALGKSYHPQCFKCSVCRVSIGHGTKFSKEGRIACVSCRPLDSNSNMVILSV